MQKINQLFGKRVIDQHSGNQCATVRDVVLDGDMRRIIALVIGDGGWGRKDRVLRWNDVVGAGEFIVVNGTQSFPLLDEDAEVRALRERAETITGKPVISASGEQIGNVDDIFFDRSGLLLGYEIRRGMFGGHPVLRSADVRSVGKDAIIAESADLLTREELESSPPPSGPRLEDRAVGEPLAGGRPMVDPALGEPEAGGSDSHRDL